MTVLPPVAAARAAAPLRAPDETASHLIRAARCLLPDLERGRAINARALRAAMERSFAGTDAEGVWTWKDAYEACEAAQVLFLRKFGPAIKARTASPGAMLAMLEKVAALLPTHTRRTEESLALQQFSTPVTLGHVAGIAAGIAPTDVVLEPSAGTGLLTVFAELAGARLALNEIADSRADLLVHLFPDTSVTRHDAAQIHDYLDEGVRPSIVLMNPPFSAAAHVEGRVADAAYRHMASALARLVEGGRLVALTGASLSPDNPRWRQGFVRLQEKGRVVFSAALDGSAFVRHGTSIATRLTVIDKLPAEEPTAFPASIGMAADAAALLAQVMEAVPPRAAPAGPIGIGEAAMPRVVSKPARPAARKAAPLSPNPVDAVELSYETIDWKPVEKGGLTEALYEGYGLQSIRIPGARAHPTRLVQSVAMASVAPPRPAYRPHLPAAVIADGLLSEAQLESVIFAGEAHARHLAGSWSVDETWDNVSAAAEDAADAVRFRRGWFLGDGTGSGKGRQVAGIVLDNWLKGRRRALWVSKSDKLIEDAQRDWSALGQERLQVTPLSRFRQGTPIGLSEGILFTTYLHGYYHIVLIASDAIK